MTTTLEPPRTQTGEPPRLTLVKPVDGWGRPLARYAYVPPAKPRPQEIPIEGSPRWRTAVLAVAAIASITCTVLSHLAGRTGWFGDEPSHLLQAERFFHSLTPGFGQLGNYWPPLLHFAELPFAWNGWLTRTGLAGQIPAMAMFLGAALGAYVLGTELARSRRAGAIGALVVVANPNMLYLQSSAMMESGIALTLVWAAVWLVRFRHTGRFRALAWAGGWSALAVFATWAALILPLYGGLVVASACRHNYFSWPKTRAYVAAYVFTSGYAVLLWLGWNWYVQNDALYMIHYRHPATSAAAAARAAATPLHPDLARGALSYASASWDSYGPVVVILAALVLVGALLRGKLLHPLGVTLVGGVLVLTEMARGQGGFIGSPTFAALEGLHGREAMGMNVRYVLWILPFVAAAVALAAGRRSVRQVLVLAAVVASSVWFLPAARGVVTLNSADMMNRTGEQQAVIAARELDRGYHGGLVLTAAAGGGDRLIWLSHIPADRFVTEFNPTAYHLALRSPASRVSYVLSTPTLREQLPQARLLADGFVRSWQTNVGGDRTSLWVRPAVLVGGP